MVPDINTLIIGFLALIFSGVLSFALTPLVRVFAIKIGAVDVPKDERRMHKNPTPLLGGLAIYIAFAVTVLMFGNLDRQTWGLLIGSAAIVTVGVIDDIYDLNPWVKLGGQIIAASVPVLMGQVISYINIFGNYIFFGSWSIPVTIFWIVLLTNAVNLIDGLDGLACGVSTISAVSLMVFAILRAEPSVALITAILTGACIGFLPSNSNPAKIFMGDTGALSLGYILAVLSIQGLFKFSAVISFVIPFMMFGLPFGDTFIAFFRRLLSGKDPFKGDRSHLHHKLIDLGFSQKQSVTILYCISAIFGIAAIMFSEERIAAAVMVIIVAIIIALLNWKVFHSDDSTRKMTGFDLAQRDSKNINASPESSDTGLDKTSEKTDAPHETVSAVSSAAPAFVKK